MPDLPSFFDRYDIRDLSISEDSDIRDSEASRVAIRCNPDPGNSTSEYRVDFKLLADASSTHRFLRGVGPPPECEIRLTEAGAALDSGEVNAVVRKLLNAICNRVAKIHKEQSILNIQPVGRTFTLASGTRFDVLADDGAGRLTIHILREDGASEASLGADDLLNGLHTGIIRLA
jgi:hypothetical protein